MAGAAAARDSGRMMGRFQADGQNENSLDAEYVRYLQRKGPQLWMVRFPAEQTQRFFTQGTFVQACFPLVSDHRNDYIRIGNVGPHPTILES